MSASLASLCAGRFALPAHSERAHHPWPVEENRRELLGRVSIFRDLSSQELDGLVAISRTRRCEARETVVQKGDKGVELYCVSRGRLKVLTEGADGQDTTFAIVGAGEVFGEIALLDGEARSATVVSLEPCELLMVTRTSFLQFLHDKPGVAVKLLAVLAQRVRRLSQRVEDRSFLELPQRLAKELVQLAERHGRPAANGAIDIPLKLSQQEIGGLVGASRESVNKVLRVWAQDGLLTHARGRVVVLNPAGLRGHATAAAL